VCLSLAALACRRLSLRDAQGSNTTSEHLVAVSHETLTSLTTQSPASPRQNTGMMPLNLLSTWILQDLTKFRWPAIRRSHRDNTTTSPSQAHDKTARCTKDFSPIRRLPQELIDQIMLYLPASSAIAFRRCNKRLYMNNWPKSPNLLYSDLCNGGDKSDHVWLLCLFERDAPQRLVCSICIAMHERKFFDKAEMSKPSERRKCRMVRLCPHRSLTFPQIQRIVSDDSTHHGESQNPPLDCTHEDCTINRSRAEHTVQAGIGYSQPWLNIIKKREITLRTSWFIHGDFECARRSKDGSLFWSWPLCPHIIMKDCCNCCREDDPGRVRVYYTWGDDPSAVSKGCSLRCKSCRTKISVSDSKKPYCWRFITVKRCLGSGTSVEDADWIGQTAPDGIRQRSRHSRRGLVWFAAYYWAGLTDLIISPY